MSEKWKCETKLFCPGPECTHHQKKDNKVTKDGFYTTKHDKPPRPRFYYHGGNHRVSETR